MGKAGDRSRTALTRRTNTEPHGSTDPSIQTMQTFANREREGL